MKIRRDLLENGFVVRLRTLDETRMLSKMLSDDGCQWESGRDLEKLNYFEGAERDIAYHIRSSKLVTKCPVSYYKRQGNRVYDFIEVLDTFPLYQEV